MGHIIDVGSYPALWRFCLWFKREHRKYGSQKLTWYNITLGGRTFKITIREVETAIALLASGAQKDLLAQIEEDLREHNLKETPTTGCYQHTFYLDEY